MKNRSLVSQSFGPPLPVTGIALPSFRSFLQSRDTPFLKKDRFMLNQGNNYSHMSCIISIWALNFRFLNNETSSVA
jgi:hypothetical protein